MARTIWLQKLLDKAWDAAPPAANTLRDQLRAFEVEADKQLEVGSLQSVSKNSASQSWAPPGPHNRGQLEASEDWRELINLFDTCATALNVGGEGDNDIPIYAEMKIRIRVPATECHTDISNGRHCYA